MSQYIWSGRRDLNPRLQPWQGCTLPLSYSRVEATSGFEPEIRILQTLALPLGHVATKFVLERETGFEPATSTLARLHSTTELLPRGVKVFIGETTSSVNRKKRQKRENFFFPFFVGKPSRISISAVGKSRMSRGGRRGRRGRRERKRPQEKPEQLRTAPASGIVRKIGYSALGEFCSVLLSAASSSASFFSSSSRRARRRTLPTRVLGSSSRNSNTRGTL